MDAELIEKVERITAEGCIFKIFDKNYIAAGAV